MERGGGGVDGGGSDGGGATDPFANCAPYVHGPERVYGPYCEHGNSVYACITPPCVRKRYKGGVRKKR